MLVMERAHKRSGLNSVLNEIESSRVEDFDLSRDTAGKKRSKTVVGAKRFSRKPHAAKSFINRQSGDSDGGGKHFDIKSRKSSSTLNLGGDLGAIMTSMSETDCDLLNHGWLYKTSRGKITCDLTRGQHEHRQYRRFQLTEHSLEYSQLLQRVC